MPVLGLDIGGANLKAAVADGHAVSRPFAIWKYPERLAAEIRGLAVQLLPNPDAIAVTMTAELADCFETKAAGVHHILAAISEVAAGRPVMVWMTDGRFATVAEAIARPLLAAASNWQALATWAARQVDAEPALLIDIGTTTTDIIPIDGGRPSANGTTDATRMIAGELVYTGIRRTPLCAVARAVPFRKVSCPLAAELFATTADIHLLLGHIDEAADDLETANGRPATRTAAHDRLARQLCCDREELTIADAIAIARDLADAQAAQIAAAINLVLEHRAPRQVVILSGSGSFLARQIVDGHPVLRSAVRVDLDQRLGPNTAAAACAYAVAVLAESSLDGLA